MKAIFKLPENNIKASFSPSKTSYTANFSIGGEGATADYLRLYNKPQINSVELVGNKTSLELGLASFEQGLLADSALQPNDNISELVNNVGYITGITSSDIQTALGYIPYSAENPSGFITVSALSGYATENWVGQQGFLTSSDLSGYATETWVNNQGYLTSINSSDVINALGYTPYNSTNPSGFITNVVNDLTNYYLKSETYTKTEVQQLIASIPQFSVVVVQTLPVTGERMILYLVPKEGASPDIYNEYIWVETDEDYELIGNTAIDLTDYVKFTDLATVATTGDYDDLSNKPTIPTTTSELTNDSGFITGITSNDVKTALGYIPYSSENPAGYITSASLPTVNNSTITIQKNGSDIESFNLNQPTNETINITVPTQTSDLTNNSGFITSTALTPYALISSLSTVATSGSYTDLSDKPTIGNGTITFTQGGVTKGTITTNQSGDTTIDFDAGGGTVDQTFDGTSQNAQSGVAIAGELKNYVPLSSQDDIEIQANTINFQTYEGKVTVESSPVLVQGSNPLSEHNESNFHVDYSMLEYYDGHGNRLFYSEPDGSGFWVRDYSSGTYPDYFNTDFNVNGIYVDTYKNGIGASANITVPSNGTLAIDGDNIITSSNLSTILANYVQSSNLASVATSGSYDDLINQPTIPTVNNSTITFTQGGVTKGTITLNQSGNTTIDFDAGGGGADVQAYTATEVETLWESI